MRIVFVRHGHPDYATDSLVEIGKIQAEVVAKRLEDEGISEIYSSTMGRAMETAAPFSKNTGLPVTGLDFMREITWGSNSGAELPYNGHPWNALPEIVKSGISISDSNWERNPFAEGNDKLKKSVKRVTEGFDNWLSGFGYVRDGEYYRVENGSYSDKTIVLFNHGGASTVVLSHMLNMPFLSACLFLRPYFTAVTVISLEGNEGDLIIPRIEILNDDRHVPKSSDGKIENKVDK